MAECASDFIEESFYHFLGFPLVQAQFLIQALCHVRFRQSRHLSTPQCCPQLFLQGINYPVEERMHFILVECAFSTLPEQAECQAPVTLAQTSAVIAL